MELVNTSSPLIFVIHKFFLLVVFLVLSTTLSDVNYLGLLQSRNQEMPFRGLNVVASVAKERERETGGPGRIICTP